MIIRSVNEVTGTERDVHGEGWRSRRLLLADDGIGYSLHETTLDAGIELRFEYRNHRETVYCLEGEGSVEDVASGRRTVLRPGSMYSAGIGEPHVVRTDTQMRVSASSPPRSAAPRRPTEPGPRARGTTVA
jgi:L-ectoine synthase